MLRDGQLERICAALWARAPRPQAWGRDERPTDIGEAILHLLVDNANLQMVGQLLCLLGAEHDQAEAAERWLATWGPLSEPEPHGARRSS